MAEPNWANRTLFHGDNLEIMRGMNSESVDLIATDPPFNKSRDFHATPDSLAKGAKFQDRWSWDRDVHPDWLDQIKDDHPAVWEVIDAANAVYMRPTKKNLRRPRDEVGSGMGAFMCFMAVRLLEMRRVLKDTGSIYLHCDPTASHYLKAVMDAIFGWRQLRNQLIWCYSTSGRAKKTFAKKHDVLLFYSKTNGYSWSDYRIPVSQKYLDSHYRQKDSQGQRCRIRVDHGKERIYYPSDGMICNDWWTEFPYVNSQAKDRTGFPTQKPLALYERMIRASANEGNIVCDPFAGCATTLVAAERQNCQWVGIDIWDNAKAVVLDRMAQERMALPEAERGDLFTETIHFTANPPKRTDAGLFAAPALKIQWSQAEPPGPRMTRSQIYEALLSRQGAKCQGCDRVFDDPRYLELDHNTPRSDGGLNHISNRILLCGPCNRLKSNIYTLAGLRRENAKRGHMAHPRDTVSTYSTILFQRPERQTT